MRAVILAMGLLWLISLNQARANVELSDDFLNAQPRVQLYMAYAEYKMANYPLAHAMWQQIDGAGKAEALFNLGIMYEQGKGVEQSLVAARDYYLQAAEAGSRAGAYQVGLMALEHPQMVPAETARHWLMVAALDGDEDAGQLLKTLTSDETNSNDPMLSVKRLLMRGDNEQAITQLIKLSEQSPANYAAITELAWLYETGLAVPRDLNKAAELFSIAAEAGNARAQYALSVMYSTGAGKPVDAELSLQWLQKSAAQNYKPAVEQLAATSEKDS
jgi:TPR repeat protein